LRSIYKESEVSGRVIKEEAFTKYEWKLEVEKGCHKNGLHVTMQAASNTIRLTIV
jgi:hypothetical protein